MGEKATRKEVERVVTTTRGKVVGGPTNNTKTSDCLLVGGVVVNPAQPISIKVGGRLQHFWKKWEEMGASSYVVNILRHGLTLEFKEAPPLVNIPVFMDSYQSNPEKQTALKLEVQELLDKEVLEVVQNPNTPGYYGRLFIRPKPVCPIKGKRWRSIMDVSCLNEYVVNPSFHMETTKSIQASMRAGMWATSIDLTDAYYHIPIHPKYLRVALFGRVLQFKAMPMVLNI
jgi:hypothetical protein